MDTIQYTPKYFKSHEIQNLSPDLVVMLDRAREVSGVPFFITSGFRTAEHNKEVGGVADSSHLKGLAVDIACNTKTDRAHIVFGLLTAGFVRIKLYKSHVHCDIDTSKLSPYLGYDGE